MNPRISTARVIIPSSFLKTKNDASCSNAASINNTIGKCTTMGCRLGKSSHEAVAWPPVEAPATSVLGLDRKSVVSGKSVSVRVDLGGGRLIITKTDRYKDLQLGTL